MSFIFLLGMFFLFIWMKSLEIANMYRFPATMNCKSINSIFENQMSLYPEYAWIDKELTLNKQGTGIY